MQTSTATAALATAPAAAELAMTPTVRKILAYIENDQPVMVWGAAGVGKSETLAAIARHLGAMLCDWRTVLHDPTDLKGIPAAGRLESPAEPITPETDAGPVTVWLRPGDLPFVGNESKYPTDRPIVLFLDEINVASPSMQAACFGLVLERMAGPHKLLPNVRIVAAGNRISDGAAAQRMPSALQNRFAHVDYSVNVDAWCDWAERAGIAPAMVAFIRWSHRPGRTPLLHVPPERGQDGRAFPTPRSVAAASAFVDAEEDIRQELVAGLVGEAFAAEFEGFRRIWSQLPPIASILADPEGAPVPNDPGTQYAVVGALAARATVENIDAVFSYTGRLSPEFATVAGQEITRIHPELTETPAFMDWTGRNRHVDSARAAVGVSQ